MRNVLAVAKRILQQFSHDQRTIVMFIAGPILILWLFSAMLGTSEYKPYLAAVDVPDEILTQLNKEDVTYIEASEVEASDLLAKQEVDAVLTLNDGVLEVEVEGADSSRTAAVAGVVQSAVQEVMAQQREEMIENAQTAVEDLQISLDSLLSVLPDAAGLPDGFEVLFDESSLLVNEVEVTYLHGSDSWNIFDFFGPVFIGIFIFVFVFITSGMSLVTERTGGTMERLLVTPIRSWQLVAGYSLGFGVVTLVQASVILWACIALIGFPNEGALWLVVLITFSMALVSLTLGLLVSAVAKTPFQVIQLMILLVVPQILLSGIFDLAGAPGWMQFLNRCFPMSYGADALRNAMLRGADFTQVMRELAILWGFIAAFFALATASFNMRRSR